MNLQTSIPRHEGSPEGSYMAPPGWLLIDKLGGRQFIKTTDPELDTGWEELARKSSLVTVNVKEFGAKGDGSNNDTAKVQGAIDSLAASGGTLYFPKGIYVCDSLDLRSAKNVTLVGSGQYSEFQYTPTTVLKCRTACETFIKLADDNLEVSANNARGVVLRDLEIDGNNLANTCVNACLAIKLINCHVLKAVNDGIVLEGGSYPVHLDHVNSNLNGRHGVNVKAPFTTVYTMRDCEFGYNTGHGILIQCGSTVVLDSIRCQSNGGDGFHVENPDPAGFSKPIFFERIAFIGCYSEGNTGYGLYVTSYDTNPASFANKITDLTFINCSFNSGVSKQVYIRGTATPTIIGSPYIGAALDATYNTIAVQTYTTYGKGRFKGQIIGESGADITGNITSSGDISGASQSLSGSSKIVGRLAVGIDSTDPNCRVRVVSDGVPCQFERTELEELNTWQLRHTGAGGAGIPGFGLYNKTSSKWGWLVTQNGTLDVSDRTTIAKTSSYAILSGENGVRFTNRGATGAISLTLPSAVIGLHYYFECYENQNLVVTPSSGESLLNGATAGDVTMTAKGCTMHVYCPKAGEWFVDFKNGF